MFSEQSLFSQLSHCFQSARCGLYSFCGCGHHLAPADSHDCCLLCLGIKHSEAAFMDESCTHCGRMTIRVFRSRLKYLRRGGVPSPIPRSSSFSGGNQKRATLANSVGDLRITVSLGGESFVSVCFCSSASGTQIVNKSAISSSSGSQEGTHDSVRCSRKALPLSSPLSLSIASGQQSMIRGLFHAFSHTLCPSMEPGMCCHAHSDPTSGHRSAFRVRSLSSTGLPHRGYICGASDPIGTVSYGLASLCQPVPLAHSQTLLCYSVRSASPPSSGVSSSLRCGLSTPLSYGWRLQCYWQRVRSSRSLQLI